MTENKNPKQYDLEDRTFLFAKNIRSFIREIVRININIDDIKQLIRSPGSIGANYIEANDHFIKRSNRTNEYIWSNS